MPGPLPDPFLTFLQNIQEFRTTQSEIDTFSLAREIASIRPDSSSKDAATIASILEVLKKLDARAVAQAKSMKFQNAEFEKLVLQTSQLFVLFTKRIQDLQDFGNTLREHLVP